MSLTTIHHIHTHTRTHTHTHTHTTSPCIYSIEGKVQQALYACTFQIFIWDWMRRCMLHVVTVHKQTCKFFRLTQVVWTCIAIVCICRSIYRWGGPAHTSAFFSLSKAHSGCKGSRREGETERHLSTSDLGRELETHTHTLMHLAITHHLHSLHKFGSFFALFWRWVALVADCVWREWIMTSFIHPSVSTHETQWIAATLKSDRNSYWTDRQVHSHTHIHIHDWKQYEAQAMSAKVDCSIQKLDTEVQILNSFELKQFPRHIICSEIWLFLIV